MLIDGLVSGLIAGTIEAASKNAEVDSVAAVRRYPTRIVRFTPEARETSMRVKRFLTANVYASPTLENDRKESTGKLERMFAYLLEHPEKVSGDPDVPLARRVCDFIAGMTDRYFLRLYEAFFNS